MATVIIGKHTVSYILDKCSSIFQLLSLCSVSTHVSIPHTLAKKEKNTYCGIPAHLIQSGQGTP